MPCNYALMNTANPNISTHNQELLAYKGISYLLIRPAHKWYLLKPGERGFDFKASLDCVIINSVRQILLYFQIPVNYILPSCSSLHAWMFFSFIVWLQIIEEPIFQ